MDHLHLTNKKEIFELLLQDLKSAGDNHIIYFYDKVFHVLKDRWVEPISNEEAYRLLKNGFLLWSINMTDQPFINLPRDCPAAEFRIIRSDEVPGKLLQTLFDLDFQTKMHEAAFNDKTISKN